MEKFKHFLSTKENSTLLINKVNEDVGCFYELALEEIAIRSNVKLDKNTNISNTRTTNDLFENEKIRDSENADLKAELRQGKTKSEVLMAALKINAE